MTRTVALAVVAILTLSCAMHGESDSAKEYRSIVQEREAAVSRAAQDAQQRFKPRFEQLLKRALVGNEVQLAVKIKEELGSAKIEPAKPDGEPSALIPQSDTLREFRRLVEERNKAITGATADIKARYKPRLDQLLRKAMLASDPEVAQAIQDDLRGDSAKLAPRDAAELKEFLSGTTWALSYGTKAAPPFRTVTFNANGTFSVKETKDVQPWRILSNRKFGLWGKEECEFAPDFKSFAGSGGRGPYWGRQVK